MQFKNTKSYQRQKGKSLKEARLEQDKEHFHELLNGNQGNTQDHPEEEEPTTLRLEV